MKVKNLQLGDCFIDQHGAFVKITEICKKNETSISLKLERVHWTEEDSLKFGRIYTCTYQKTADGNIVMPSRCYAFQRKEAIIY